MDNIVKLQEHIQTYVDNKLEEHYTFDLWKDTLVHCRNNQAEHAINLWNFFDDKFFITNLIPDVESIAEFKTFNVNPQKLEDLIHTFFNRVKLDIKVKDDSGNIKSPKEWYIVPLEIIKQVIELIISGEIINYRYDDLNQRLVITDQ